jgi:hypothetical protein
MSSSAPHSAHALPSSPAPVESQDPVEAVVSVIHIVLPVVGAVLMFLLAFIAIYMA